ncbi:MAG: 30S ribosomal protein S18 [Pseudomonadota bacterium]
MKRPQKKFLRNKPEGPPREEGPFSPGRKKFFHKKICRFCNNKNMIIDYKNPEMLRLFVTDRGKIIPRRINGNCSKHQKAVTVAIKRARHLALIPFTVK